MSTSPFDYPADTSSRSDLLAAARIVDDVILGYVADRLNPERRFVVDLTIDGLPAAIARADRVDRAMPDFGGARDYGFAFDLTRLPTRNFALAEIWLANSSERIADLDMSMVDATPGSPAIPGAVFWRGGLHFDGFLTGENRDGREVRALLDEQVVAQTTTCGTRLVEDETLARAAARFQLHLPERYADARAHQVEVLDDAGKPLFGSPVSFVAFPDGYEDVLAAADVPAARIKGSLRAQLFSRAVPFSGLASWEARFAGRSKRSTPRSDALVLVGDSGMERSLESLGDALRDVVVGVLRGEVADGRFAPSDLAEFIEHLEADRAGIVFALSGTQFAANIVDDMIDALAPDAGAILSYCDFIHQDGDRLTPVALPDHDDERFLEQAYSCWCFAMTTAAVRDALAAGVDSLAGLFFDGLARSTKPPRHVTRFGARLPTLALTEAADRLRSAIQIDLQRRSLRADLSRISKARLLPAIRVQRLVSADSICVVIATRNEAEHLRACVGRLAEQETRHKLDIVIVDMGSSQPAQLRLLHELARRMKIVRMEGPPGSARTFNRGFQEARHRLVLFLEACVEPHPGLVEEMVSRCADADVAACGAMLIAKCGLVQSMGLVLTLSTGAQPACRGFSLHEAGYGDMLSVAQQRSALASQCLMIKSADFRSVGGFDDAVFSRFMHVVDLGLKLRARHRRLIVSPHALATNTRPDYLALEGADPLWASALRRERDLLHAKWGGEIDEDPFYSPLLAETGDLFSALAWPPRARPLKPFSKLETGQENLAGNEERA